MPRRSRRGSPRRTPGPRGAPARRGRRSRGNPRGPPPPPGSPRPSGRTPVCAEPPGVSPSRTPAEVEPRRLQRIHGAVERGAHDHEVVERQHPVRVRRAGRRGALGSGRGQPVELAASQGRAPTTRRSRGARRDPRARSEPCRPRTRPRPHRTRGAPRLGRVRHHELVHRGLGRHRRGTLTARGPPRASRHGGVYSAGARPVSRTWCFVAPGAARRRRPRPLGELNRPIRE